MHTEARDYVEKLVAGRLFPAVVEVGGRWINGGVRDLIAHQRYLSLDLHPGPGVDIVGDVRDYTPPRLAKADLVICCEVIEHAEDPRGVVDACLSLLAPGALMILTCAGPHRAPHSGIDGGPVRDGEHYGNIDPDDLRKWLADFDAKVDYYPDRGDLYASAFVWPVES